MERHAFDIGPIRPPSEANSLLLQVEKGCTWNKCRFCVVYRGSTFRMIPPEQVKQNIDNMAYFRDLLQSHVRDDGRLDREALYQDLESLTQEELHCFYMVYNWLAAGGKSVFLQDGNSIAIKPEKLADILFYLKETFPQIERITTYGRAETLSRCSVEQLKLLKESGLNRIHAGYETGSDAILQMINKGLTQAQQIEAGRKVKEAGMELSVYFMPGIGGLEWTAENAEQTAYVVNQIDPDFVRMRTFILKYDSEMYPMMQNGEFTELTDIGKLKEIRDLVAGITQPEVQIVSDHIVNLIGSMNGRIREDKKRMLAQADRILQLPAEERRLYQVVRRQGLINDYPDLALLSPAQVQRARAVVGRFGDEASFDAYLNEILRNYV